MSVRPLALLLVAALAACTSTPDSDNNTPPPPPPPPPPGLLISGADMSGSGQNISVRRSGDAVTTATTVVNGTTMTHAGFGLYQGTISPIVAVGGQVTVVVTDAGQTATGVGIVPAAAVIAAPAATARGNPLTVNWTSPTSPDSFAVGLNYTIGNSSYNVLARTSGTIRQAVLPTTDVPVGATNLSITAFGYNIGNFTGSFAVGSNMRVRTLSPDLPFTFTP